MATPSAPAELFYQQNVQRATVGTIHQYVPGSSHNFRSPTGTMVQDRFPPRNLSSDHPRSNSPRLLRRRTEEIKARYQRSKRGYPQAHPSPETAPDYNYGAKEDLDRPIGSDGDRLRQFQDSGLAQLVPRLVSLHSCLPLLRTVTTPSTAGGGTERVQLVSISTSTGRATLSCRRRARRWDDNMD